MLESTADAPLIRCLICKNAIVRYRDGMRDVMWQTGRWSMGLAMLIMLTMGCVQEPSSYRSGGRSTVDQRLGGNPTRPVPPIPPAPATGNRPPGPEY